MQAASPSVPVDGSKLVEVLQHYAMKVFETIQFPKLVQVGHPILPQSRNLTERSDNAAALWVRLSDHRHAAAAARTCHCQCLNPGQRQCNGTAPQTPPGHPHNKYSHSALPTAAPPALPGTTAAKQGGWSKYSAPLAVLIKALYLNFGASLQQSSLCQCLLDPTIIYFMKVFVLVNKEERRSHETD